MTEPPAAQPLACRIGAHNLPRPNFEGWNGSWQYRQRRSSMQAVVADLEGRR
jgi:hypothetical protein